VTAQQIITASMRKLAIAKSGETLSTQELADGLEVLQTMLRAWSAVKIAVFASVEESFTLGVGTASYTWYSGGTFNSVRPHKVTGAYVQDSDGYSHPVRIISEGLYRSFALKATSGRPSSIFPLYGFPYVTVYLYPVPNAAESLHVDSLKPFTETSSFDALGSTLSFPVYYEEAIIYNLAIRLAPEYGKTVPAEVVAIATRSYDNLITLNASNQVEPIIISVPASHPAAGYDINSDTGR